MVQASNSPVAVGTLHRLTQKFPYFEDWTIPELKALAPSCRTLVLSDAEQLIQINGVEPFAYFLLKGGVELVSSAGEIRSIRQDDPDAGFPIAHHRPSQYTVTASPGSELLRIESSKLRSHEAKRKPAIIFTEDEVQQRDWMQHPLVGRLVHQARNGHLSLPAMPGIALKLRKALENDDYRVDDIAAIISADPAIVARLLKVANSAIFRGQQPFDSVHQALVRLGVGRAQQIVMSLATRDLFVVKDGHLKSLMLQRWRHAIDIAAICAVLARMTPGLQSDRAMLVGLLHEIGVLPLLRAAEAYPDILAKPEMLQEMVTCLTPELSALVLEQWGFDLDVASTAHHQNHWFRDHEGPADYTDVLIIAHLHALVRDRIKHKLPRIDEVPAFNKMALGQLTPSLSLTVLEEANSHIQELKTLLT